MRARIQRIATYVTVTVALACWTSCEKSEQPGEQVDQEGLVTVTVRRQNMAVKVNATGTLEPVRTIEIKSKASGKILRLPVETGQRVARGALLALVDTTAVAANLRQRQATLDHARARFEIAERQKNRDDDLLRRGMISQDAIDRSLLEYTSTRASFINAQAELEKAQEQRDDTILRAPIAGTILEKKVEEGQIIASATSGLSEGTTILAMADLSTMQVRVLVDETDLGRIRPGQPAVVTPDTYPERRFAGEVLKIEPKAKKEREAIYFPALIHIDNRDGVLLPDMNCKVVIDIVSKENALVVSTDALVPPADAVQIGNLLNVPEDSVKAALESVGASGGPRMAQGWGMSRAAMVQMAAARGPQASDAAVVFVADSTGISVHAVRVGLKDWDVTEIAEGADDGDVVLLPPSSMVAEQFAEFQKLLDRFGGKLPGRK